MRAVDIILSKRDGATLTRDEIRFFVDGVTAGTLPDYQASALLMAILLRGMTAEETAWLTDAMVDSGVRVDLGDIPGVKVDKHSTGGVGDKTSLILAPLAAACGVPVPMMSGRGLGHTGGTLDKLEAIPGFRVNLSREEMKAALAKIGCAMIGQTAQIAPADKKLYALRDVTGTVESIPLISASIMSKKIAEGIDALVLDVKTGSGAFMKTEADSRTLAESLVAIGSASGVKTEAIITAMDSPLGCAVGNALEVIEAFDVLRGRAPEDLTELTLALCAQMLILGGKAKDEAQARQRLEEVRKSGAALEKFREIIRWQGGDPAVVDHPERLPRADRTTEVKAAQSGFVGAIDSEGVGLAAVALGAGREKVDSKIDPAVGFTLLKKVRDPVAAGEALVRIHHQSDSPVADVEARLRKAFRMSATAPAKRPLVLERL